MIYPIYILLTVITLLMIYYSFSNQDKSYYTDVLTSLTSCIFAGILAYNSIMGVEFNLALESAVNYDIYASAPISIIFTLVAVVMAAFFVMKILDITHKEVNQI